MIDKNLAAYKIPYGMYIAIGGDPNMEFTSIADIYTEINKIYASVGNRLDIEPLKVEFTTNGTKVFNEDAVTGYKPVEVSVNVDVGTAYEDGYNTGYGEGYNQGETTGYNTGYSEGLDYGIADQKSKLESISITENGTYNREDGYNVVKVSVQGKLEVPFEEIGYPSELKDELNDRLNSKPLSDLEYSKSLYDAWNPDKNSASRLYFDDKKLVYAPNIVTSNVVDMRYMFHGCSSLTTVPLFDTSKVTIMDNMFYGCSSLTTVPLFDTSKVTEMGSMFDGCSSLTTVPLFNTSNVTDMYGTFDGCSSLTNVPHFNTSNVTAMSYMLQGCSSLTNVPHFNTSNVTAMNSTFDGCSSLVSIPLLDLSKVTTMNYMFGFSEMKNLTDIGGFKNLGAQPTLSGTNDNYFLYKAPNMTHDSAVNIINNLYDRKSAGYSVITLKFASKTLALLSDEEKAIATNKGWTIS